ncbi:MAG: 4a-hydroxytetrahydrobiopterin dehydratase [Patescibacteria group bacterium]|nr:4a-hydroxytetrahydrobiopterin dehydratase [Patescibacteria group bacterium]
MTLSQKKCVPCEGGTKPLSHDDIMKYLAMTPGWHLSDNETSMKRSFVFKNFSDALKFVNAVAKIAEEEQHHPDILLHNWNHVDLILSTHAIHGLSENDFILAAKINTINTASQ